MSIPLPHTTKPVSKPSTWKEHIKTRPPWEQLFLTKVKIPSAPALTAALNTPSVTEAPNHLTADSAGKLVTFRTECYAILTWTTFLLEYISFKITPPAASLTPYSDSEKAIQTTSTAFTTLFQHKPIRPDYDISTALNAQFTVLSTIWPILHPITHIHAHQLLPPHIQKNPPLLYPTPGTKNIRKSFPVTTLQPLAE